MPSTRWGPAQLSFERKKLPIRRPVRTAPYDAPSSLHAPAVPLSPPALFQRGTGSLNGTIVAQLTV